MSNKGHIVNASKSLSAQSQKIQKKYGKNPLAEALSELSNELILFDNEKRELEEKLNSINRRIGGTQQNVLTLKEKLKKLELVESELQIEKMSDEHKLADIRNKLRKIKTAREELSEP